MTEMKYFTIKELCASDTAKARRIDNIPSANEVENLRRLVVNILDPLREAWGKPLHVNSGYRCQALNKAVGGAKTSDHVYGQAADITAIHPDRAERIKLNRQLFELIKEMDLPYKQLIDEYGCTWLHISYQQNSTRHEIKIIK